MVNRESHSRQIIEYLTKHPKGASACALDRMFGYTDSRKRISELRRRGYQIKDKYVTERKYDGTVSHFKIYYMEEK